jgi:hypothetical protein
MSCNHDWVIDDCYHYDDEVFPVRSHRCRRCKEEVWVIDPELIESRHQYDKFWDIMRDIARERNSRGLK